MKILSTFFPPRYKLLAKDSGSRRSYCSNRWEETNFSKYSFKDTLTKYKHLFGFYQNEKSASVFISGEKYINYIVWPHGG